MAGSWRSVAAGWTALLAACLSVRTAVAGGTTPNLRHIFIGRCWEYQTIVNPTAFATSGTKDCTRLYEYFLQAFEGRSPCDVEIDRYSNYAKESQHPIELNKSMFWVGVYQLVQRYSERGRRFTTIADTLAGYVVDSLIWCSKEGGGLDVNFCPNYGSCEHESSLSFWRSASKTYASLARGTAYVMLNGTRGDREAFTENSVFAQYELPYMEQNLVTKVHVYVIHDIGKTPQESCGSVNSSVSKLERRIRERGFDYECTDNPVSVRLLQCVDQTGHHECQGIIPPINKSSKQQTTPLLSLMWLVIGALVISL